MRADAQRNRDQILAAARGIFVETGTNVPMEEIARRAGVGIGTLYRRFPDRHALIQAVAMDSIHRLAGIGRAAWEEEPDAWSALCRFVRGGGDLRLVLATVRPQLLDTVRENNELLEAGQAWYDLLAQMVEGAQSEGVLRTDVGPGDIALMLDQLTRPLPRLSARLAAVIPDRFVELMLDGLRARPETPLPGQPIAEWWL